MLSSPQPRRAMKAMNSRLFLPTAKPLRLLLDQVKHLVGIEEVGDAIIGNHEKLFASQLDVVVMPLCSEPSQHHYYSTRPASLESCQ